MWWILLSGCLGRSAPAYTWTWSNDVQRAQSVAPRAGRVLAVFVGDGGKPHPGGALAKGPCTAWSEDAVALALRDELVDGGELFWLGDNVYPSGPRPGPVGTCEEGDPWALAHAALQRQVGAAPDPSRAHFLPGNHDYAQGAASARPRIEAQAVFLRTEGAQVHAYKQPVEAVELPGVTVLTYDSQWAIRGHGEQMLPALDAVVRAAEQPVVIAAHHGIHTLGPHGYEPWRGMFTDTDVANVRFNRWRQRLMPSLELWQALGQAQVVFAGHDHSLQLLQVDQGFYVTTGAGAKVSPVKSAQGPLLRVLHAESTLGYSVLTALDGVLAVELVTVREGGGEGCVAIGSTGWSRCRVAQQALSGR